MEKLVYVVWKKPGLSALQFSENMLGKVAERMLGVGVHKLSMNLVDDHVDYAAGMLDQARQAAQTLPQEARARLTLRQMAAGDAGQAFAPGSFEAITCHTLIEFLPDGRCILRNSDEVIWIKKAQAKTPTSVTLEGGYTHTIKDDSLHIEGRYTGRRKQP